MSKSDLVDIYNPTRKYNLIIADPPWQYATPGYNGGTLKHYECMNLTEICKLPVQNLADTDCALFLWTTAPMMAKAQQVIEAWGFTYKTIFFNWVKTTKDKQKPTQRIPGWYTRNCVEYLLVATRGNMNQYRDKSLNLSSLFYEYSPAHSRKPDYPMNKIVQMYGDLPRLEMFARRKLYGWDCWGNQVNEQVSVQYTLQVQQQSIETLHKLQQQTIELRKHQHHENKHPAKNEDSTQQLLIKYWQ